MKMFWRKNKMSKFELTKEMLAAMIPGNSKVDMWYDAIVEIFPKYDINTPERMAGFIAQCAHESNNFKSLEENLNYSESALNRVFERYFGKAPKRNAKEYARNPERLLITYTWMSSVSTRWATLKTETDGYLEVVD